MPDRQLQRVLGQRPGIDESVAQVDGDRQEGPEQQRPAVLDAKEQEPREQHEPGIPRKHVDEDRRQQQEPQREA